MANDNVLDYKERQIIKDKLTDILGYIIPDSTNSLPTVTTLDASLKGDFYNVRKSSVHAGILTTDPLYVAVATQYTALKNYLDSMTPIRPWNLNSTSRLTNITVVKETFRTIWLNFYLAIDALSVETNRLLRLATDNVDGRLTTVQESLTTSINQTNQQIQLKANQTSVDSLIGRVTSAEGSITTMANQIQLKVSQNQLDSAINNIKIGGANILRGTKLFPLDWTGQIGFAYITTSTTVVDVVI